MLKAPDWENIVPLHFYFMPLRKRLDDVIHCLLDMNRAGPLRCKYVIEQNTELQEKVIAMAKADRIAQWVGANVIRRDQLMNVYNIIKIMFDSPLRSIMVNEQGNEKLISDVIPMYIAYYAIKNHMDIDAKKEKDRLNKIDKRLRRGLPAEEEEPEPVVEEEVKYKKPALMVHMSASKKKEVIVEEVLPRPTDEKKETVDQYGRYWMFVNYFSESEEMMNLWTTGSEAMSRINPAVLTDIDDHILLQGFKTQRLSASNIQGKITGYLDTMRARELMRARKAKLETDPVEEGKALDKKREFLNPFRPDKRIWNFNEDEDPTPHVLRIDADPAKAYVDGRIEELLDIIERIAMHLKTFTGETWDALIKYVVKIFIDKEAAEKAEYTEWASTTTN